MESAIESPAKLVSSTKDAQNASGLFSSEAVLDTYPSMGTSVGVCPTANSTPKIKSFGREGLLRSPALSLAWRALAASARFQLPRPSLKRWKRKRALCRQFAGQA
jgi:hypothetical protein